mgnify:CR=1 FL=1
MEENNIYLLNSTSISKIKQKVVDSMKKIDKIGYLLIALALFAYVSISTVGTLQNIKKFDTFKQQFVENINNL